MIVDLLFYRGPLRSPPPSCIFNPLWVFFFGGGAVFVYICSTFQEVLYIGQKYLYIVCLSIFLPFFHILLSFVVIIFRCILDIVLIVFFKIHCLSDILIMIFFMVLLILVVLQSASFPIDYLMTSMPLPM